MLITLYGPEDHERQLPITGLAEVTPCDACGDDLGVHEWLRVHRDPIDGLDAANLIRGPWFVVDCDRS